MYYRPFALELLHGEQPLNHVCGDGFTLDGRIVYDVFQELTVTQVNPSDRGRVHTPGKLVLLLAGNIDPNHQITVRQRCGADVRNVAGFANYPEDDIAHRKLLLQS